MKPETYDHRYAYVTCAKCGHKWQRIDYGSARHALTCGYPYPPQVEPVPEKWALTPEEWQAFDQANGINLIP